VWYEPPSLWVAQGDPWHHHDSSRKSSDSNILRGIGNYREGLCYSSSTTLLLNVHTQFPCEDDEHWGVSLTSHVYSCNTHVIGYSRSWWLRYIMC
jgi:hypothetical protein